VIAEVVQAVDDPLARSEGEFEEDPEFLLVAGRPECIPRPPEGRCHNHGIRVVSADGCSRRDLEQALDLWFGPLQVWTDGSIRDAIKAGGESDRGRR
jgi:hypothetical protein